VPSGIVEVDDLFEREHAAVVEKGRGQLDVANPRRLEGAFHRDSLAIVDLRRERGRQVGSWIDRIRQQGVRCLQQRRGSRNGVGGPIEGARSWYGEPRRGGGVGQFDGCRLIEQTDDRRWVAEERRRLSQKNVRIGGASNYRRRLGDVARKLAPSRFGERQAERS